ncbi:MAG: histidine kinase dimerization/phosphoacceptor domain -containing protein, partial [Candidatus Entotheonellia bacterium]
ALGRRLEMPARRADGSEFPAELTLTHIPIEGPPMFTGYVRDITERTRTENALQASESRFRQLAENIQEVFWLSDPHASQILYMSPAYEEVWGRSCQSLYENTASFLEAIHPEDLPRVVAVLEAQCRGEPTDAEYRIVRPDGSVRWIWDRAFPIKDEAGRAYRIAGIAQDISQRRQAEGQLKALLSEKEILLKEIHHRVKNNLQVISSLIDLQADSIEHPQALQAFKESQQRIKSMALIHEQLYQSGNLARIDMAEYIQQLAAISFRTYGVAPAGITLQLTAEEVFLNLDTAIPCGLILNELLSNSLKHAFPGGRPGEITITLCATPEGTYALMVRDTGVGLPKDVDIHRPESLGLQLVSMLTDQLDGTMELDSREGTTFRLTFTELPERVRK